MDENYNGFNTDNPDPSGAPQFDYSQPDQNQYNYGQPGTTYNYGQTGYGQPNNTAQSDYNQVYNQPNYNQQYTYPNYSGGYQATEGKKNDTKSILSLVFGIAGLVLCSCGGIGGVIFGIVGIIMAILSKGENDGEMKGMAVAGMILSILSFIIGLISIAVLIIMIASDTSIFNNF